MRTITRYCQHFILPFLFILSVLIRLKPKWKMEFKKFPYQIWSDCNVALWAKTLYGDWSEQKKKFRTISYTGKPHISFRIHIKLWSFEFWFQIHNIIRDTIYKSRMILLCLDFKSHDANAFCKFQKKNGTKLQTQQSHNCGFTISIAIHKCSRK